VKTPTMPLARQAGESGAAATAAGYTLLNATAFPAAITAAACSYWPCPPPPTDRLDWWHVRSRIALLRGSDRPGALVLLTLFPPRAVAREKRAACRYYLATVLQGAA